MSLSHTIIGREILPSLFRSLTLLVLGFEVGSITLERGLALGVMLVRRRITPLKVKRKVCDEQDELWRGLIFLDPSSVKVE